MQRSRQRIQQRLLWLQRLTEESRGLEGFLGLRMGLGQLEKHRFPATCLGWGSAQQGAADDQCLGRLQRSALKAELRGLAIAEFGQG